MNDSISMSQITNLLSEWSEKGDFFYSTKSADWEKQAGKIWDMKEGYMFVAYYYAYAISYILEKIGRLSLSYCKNKWDWARGLVVLAPVANWDAATFHSVIVAFGKKPSNDIINQLSYSVRLFCKKDFDKGLTLMAIMPNKALDCMSGMMMNDFKRACENFDFDKDPEQFARAFVGTENMDNEAVCHAYDIAVSFSAFASSTALAFFLKALPSLDDERINDCEDRVKELLGIESSSSIGVLCNWLCRQETISTFMEDCLLLSLAHLENPEADLRRLDMTLCYRLINIELFEKISTIIAETYRPDFIPIMDNCLHKLRKDDASFVRMVLSFIIHLKGNCRQVGRKIWDEFHLESSQFDPLTMTEEEQMVFAVFMLQDLGNPDLRLPKVLPLFLSPSEKVRQTLLDYMIFYADNYMGHVTQALDKLKIDTQESKLLKQYIEDRGAFVQKRRKLKELSPMYSQYKYFQEACRIEKECKSQQVKEFEEESAPFWMNMFKTEVLARGGGWRLKDGKTHHLTPIEVSVPSRIMIQSMTPLERDRWFSEIIKDWDDAKRNN